MRDYWPNFNLIPKPAARPPAAPIVVIFNGRHKHPVYRVDPFTFRATDEFQQFRMHPDGQLEIIHKPDWIADPIRLELGLEMRYN